MIKVKDLKKYFYEGEVETKVLKGLDLYVEKGEFVAIMGRSGAGKSTFLYQVSLLDEPTSGEIIIDNVDTHNFNEEQKVDFRLRELGYVFQDYALLPDLTALENVALPLLMQGKTKEFAYKNIEDPNDIVQRARQVYQEKFNEWSKQFY
jgi:putative ABC transport system ATP-binding protein